MIQRVTRNDSIPSSEITKVTSLNPHLAPVNEDRINMTLAHTQDRREDPYFKCRAVSDNVQSRPSPRN